MVAQAKSMEKSCDEEQETRTWCGGVSAFLAGAVNRFYR